MKKITTTIIDYDDKTGEKIGASTTENTFTDEEWEAINEDGFLGACDGDCENCEDSSLCEDSIDADDLSVDEIEIDLYDLVAKTLSLTALFFSAATVFKAWKKVR